MNPFKIINPTKTFSCKMLAIRQLYKSKLLTVNDQNIHALTLHALAIQAVIQKLYTLVKMCTLAVLTKRVSTHYAKYKYLLFRICFVSIWLCNVIYTSMQIKIGVSVFNYKITVFYYMPMNVCKVYISNFNPTKNIR